MVRPLMAALIATFTVTACGGPSPASQGPSVSTVAVQSGDLPKGMVRCDLTGDINSFITKEQSQDPQTSRSVTTYWADLKKAGATAAYAAIYTDSATHCSAVKSSTSDPAVATYKVVVNFVVQFKDEKSASGAYTGDSFFGFSASTLRSGGVAIEGTKTGLTANSIVLDQSISNQSFYIALWQNKTFDVILAVINVDSNASKKVAASENGRIK